MKYLSRLVCWFRGHRSAWTFMSGPSGGSFTKTWDVCGRCYADMPSSLQPGCLEIVNRTDKRIEVDFDGGPRRG